MAPDGPSSEPPPRGDEPRRRRATPDDWGDADWEVPVRRRRGEAAPAPEPEPAPPRPDPGPRPRVAVDGPADRPARAAAGPLLRTNGLSPALRRRALAIAGLVLAVAVLVVAVQALAGGGDDTGGISEHHLLAAPLGSAATDAVDRLDRAAAVERYVRLGLPVYCGAGRKPWVALTLDDGPWPLSPQFLSLLSRERVPVTVFRIGRNVPGREQFVQAERNLGWDSGSHTQNHPPLATLSARDQREEITKGQNASIRALGRKPRLFRPPYESHNATTDRIVRDLDMVQVLWNVDTQDALGVPAKTIAERAIRGLKPGSIILMHEVKPNTLAALPQIIAEIRKRGLEPVTISKMLAGDGPSEAQLRKGFDGCPVDLTPGKAAS
ncbi:polysaccharide deacetylase family protein [Patulibacter defluvii]|uniref:polysaccharide deacetylase family protein n=1 Tax=Patulibacter defluvii TaxID=3095358 RepID=UPI002A753BF2|nr:polysaccharide deacetylase family protein [Patulibacter sp. DM4]